MLLKSFIQTSTLSIMLKFMLSISTLLLINGCVVFMIISDFNKRGNPFSIYEYHEISKPIFSNSLKVLSINSYPDSLKNFFIHYGFNLESEPIRSLNADSISFHFILKDSSQNDIIYWAVISGGESFWYGPDSTNYSVTELGLLGISENYEGWVGFVSETRWQKLGKKKYKRYIDRFEKEVLSKLDSIIYYRTIKE